MLKAHQLGIRVVLDSQHRRKALSSSEKRLDLQLNHLSGPLRYRLLASFF